MSFIFKLSFLLFILAYYGTDASTDLVNTTDSIDMAIVVNNMLNCSLVENYFQFLNTQEVIKSHFSSKKYISRCMDYLRQNTYLKNLTSSYIFIPGGLLHEIHKNYQKYKN